MAGRNPLDPTVKIGLENLQAQISGLKRQAIDLQNSLNSMSSGLRRNISQPQPAVPHQIADRSDVRGTYPTVKFLIPATSQEIRGIYIPRDRNQILPGETMAQAITRAFHETHNTTFRFL